MDVKIYLQCFWNDRSKMVMVEMDMAMDMDMVIEYRYEHVGRYEASVNNFALTL